MLNLVKNGAQCVFVCAPQRLSLSHSLSRKRTPKSVNLNITKTLRTLTQKAMYKLYYVGKIYYDRYDGLDTCSCMCVYIYMT